LGKIENNPGKRAVAKICLNSLWGKFGQRQNMGATEYVTDIKRFYEILLDDRLDNIHIIYFKIKNPTNTAFYLENTTDNVANFCF
jgi:hypothetical protein